MSGWQKLRDQKLMPPHLIALRWKLPEDRVISACIPSAQQRVSSMNGAQYMFAEQVRCEQ